MKTKSIETRRAALRELILSRTKWGSWSRNTLADLLYKDEVKLKGYPTSRSVYHACALLKEAGGKVTLGRDGGFWTATLSI